MQDWTRLDRAGQGWTATQSRSSPRAAEGQAAASRTRSVSPSEACASTSNAQPRIPVRWRDGINPRAPELGRDPIRAAWQPGSAPLRARTLVTLKTRMASALLGEARWRDGARPHASLPRTSAQNADHPRRTIPHLLLHPRPAWHPRRRGECAGGGGAGAGHRPAAGGRGDAGAGRRPGGRPQRDGRQEAGAGPPDAQADGRPAGGRHGGAGRLRRHQVDRARPRPRPAARDRLRQRRPARLLRRHRRDGHVAGRRPAAGDADEGADRRRGRGRHLRLRLGFARH